jgi:hypothetical protein
LATVTLAAACADRLSNYCLYGLDASSRMYSSTLIVMLYGNTCVTSDVDAIFIQGNPEVGCLWGVSTISRGCQRQECAGSSLSLHQLHACAVVQPRQEYGLPIPVREQSSHLGFGQHTVTGFCRPPWHSQRASLRHLITLSALFRNSAVRVTPCSAAAF